jgi:hypothetical protein
MIDGFYPSLLIYSRDNIDAYSSSQIETGKEALHYFACSLLRLRIILDFVTNYFIP